MTIKELNKKYPQNKYTWIARKDGYPNWNYNDDDIVIKYELKEKQKSIDITNCVFGKGKAKVEYVNKIELEWKRV